MDNYTVKKSGGAYYISAYPQRYGYLWSDGEIHGDCSDGYWRSKQEAETFLRNWKMKNENYVMLGGVRCELSDETVKNLMDQLIPKHKIKVGDLLEWQACTDDLHLVVKDWQNPDRLITVRKDDLNYQNGRCRSLDSYLAGGNYKFIKNVWE